MRFLLIFAVCYLWLTPMTAAAAIDCRIDAGACSKSVAGLSVEFDLLPKPVKTMRELTFSVVLKEGNRLVQNASVSVNLSMPGMFMGKNTVLLIRQADGRYEGKGVIVRCPSGSPVWKATVIIRRAGKTRNAEFVFEAH